MQRKLCLASISALCISYCGFAIEAGASYKIHLTWVSEGAFFRDPSVRERTVGTLYGLDGDEADAFSVLMWIKEPKLELQEKLLKRIFADPPVEKEELAKHLYDMTAIYDQGERDSRKQMIEQTSRADLAGVLPQNRKKKPEGMGAACALSCVPVSALWGAPGTRQEAYANVFKNFPAGGDTVALMLLWYAEPDGDLRRFLLEQGREINEVVRCDTSFPKELMQLAQGLSKEQQTVRSEEINHIYSLPVPELKRPRATIETESRDDEVGEGGGSQSNTPQTNNADHSGERQSPLSAPAAADAPEGPNSGVPHATKAHSTIVILGSGLVGAVIVVGLVFLLLRHRLPPQP